MLLPTVAGRLREEASTFARWALPPRSRGAVTFWLIIAVNLIVLSLYLWSRGGATTDIRVEAIGDTYRASIDGRTVLEGRLTGRSMGGIGFELPPRNRLPGLPEPSGFDWVRVTDADTGTVLLEDDFDGAPAALWQETRGWDVRDGAFMTEGERIATTGPQPWRDYIVEAKLRNVTRATLYLRLEDPKNAAAFEIAPYRGNPGSRLTVIEDGEAARRLDAPRAELDRPQSIRSITAMLLRPYPTAFLIMLGAVAVALALRVERAESGLARLGRAIPEYATGIVIGLAVGAAVVLGYILYAIGDAMPHVPDSVLYVFQAKIFASFHLTADAPPARASFEIFHPPFLQVVDGRWFSHYLFGHPLFLAVGQFVGAPWLVPPLLGAGSIVLIYWFGRRVYGVTVGLVAAVLLFFSPFFLMTASNLMSHNTAAFVLLACLVLLTLPTRRRMLSMFFAGIALGLLFNIRPLTAVAFIPVLGAFMAYELWRARPERMRLLREDVAFGAGGALLLIAYFLYNLATTGDFTTTPYALQGTYSENFIGFSGTHSVSYGIQNQGELLSLLLLVANGWPLAFGFALAALPFLLGTRNRWDYFLALSFLAITGATIFYRNAAVMHGPRFWYESLPFLILLTARGAQELHHAAAVAGAWLARRAEWRPLIPSTATTGLAVYGLVAGLVAFSASGWLFETHEPWPDLTFTPNGASDLNGFNFADDRLLDRADDLDSHDALIFVEQCPHWWCYGTVFWTNTPNLNGDIVWAERQHDADDRTVIEHFRGRDLYLADYDDRTIRSVTAEELLADIEPATASTGGGVAP